MLRSGASNICNKSLAFDTDFMLDLNMCQLHFLYRGSYMSAHALLNLLNELGKEIKREACRAFYLFFATSLINSIIQEHEC